MIRTDEALRLLRTIAEYSGATLSEETSNGELRVHLIFPAAASRSTIVTDTPPPVRAGEKLRVLHVEDTDRAGDLINYYLRSKYDVETVRDAREALAVALKSSFDCILMDMNLGDGMSGFELTEAFRKLDGYAKTPIIAITGYTAKKDVERCLAAGCSAYLSKPFLKEDLLQVMRELGS